MRSRQEVEDEKDKCRCGNKKYKTSKVCRKCYQINTGKRRPETYYKKSIK